MYHKLTLEQFLELREVEKVEYDSNIDKLIDVISIIEDCDPETLTELSLSELDKRFKANDFVLNEPPKMFRKEIEGYNFKELSTLTLAEYIDLSHYFQEDYIDNLPTICGILYRRGGACQEWGHPKIEPYEYDPVERGKMFLSLPVTYTYGIIQEFIKFKEDFEDTYAPLFEPEFDEDEEYEPTEEDKIEEEKKKFSWEHFVYNLCDGDLTKSNNVLNLGLIYVFNMLAMKNTYGD